MKIRTSPENVKKHQQYMQMLYAIQKSMDDMGYMHIDTPVLSSQLIPESYLEIFKTNFEYSDQHQDLYLIPSPELFLKRLIAQGIGSCYSLTKTFRNGEPSSTKHSPEFTLLEFYKVNSDYMNLAEDVLSLLRSIAVTMYGQEKIIYKNKQITLDSWEKITVSEAFERYANIQNVTDEQSFMKQAAKKDYSVEGFSYTDIWSQIYAHEVEPHLGTNGRPTLIYEYPKALAATAQYDPIKKVAQRLEVYIEGVELGNCGNASTAETDIDEERQKLEKETALRKKLGRIEHVPDMEFAEVLTKMPPTAGIAIGVDRLGMVFTDSDSIHDLSVISVG